MASRREAVGFLLLGLGAMMLCLSPAGLARTGHTKGTVDATPTERREALDAEPRSDVVVSACGGLAAKTRPERTHQLCRLEFGAGILCDSLAARGRVERLACEGPSRTKNRMKRPALLYEPRLRGTIEHAQCGRILAVFRCKKEVDFAGGFAMPLSPRLRTQLRESGFAGANVPLAEQRAFERIVTAACGGAVAQRHVTDLISDLADQLAEDGVDMRIQRLGEGIARREHAQEVIRIAALIAQCSEDVGAVERSVLEKLAMACKLEPSEVDAAFADVKKALRG